MVKSPCALLIILFAISLTSETCRVVDYNVKMLKFVNLQWNEGNSTIILEFCYFPIIPVFKDVHDNNTHLLIRVAFTMTYLLEMRK